MTDKKVICIEDRIPKLKERRKRRANRRFFTYLTIILLLIVVIVYLQSPLSHLKSIEVMNNLNVDDSEIIQLSQLTTDQSYWNININETIDHIKQHPEIDDVQIQRKWYNRLIVEVSELSRVGYVNNGSNYYPILENGNILDSFPLEFPKGDAPILYEFIDEAILVELTTQLAQLEDPIVSLISEIFWEPIELNQYRIRLFMTDGQEVIASIRNFKDKMSIYPSIASQLDPMSAGILYIDVGAYFQPFSQEIEDDLIELDLDEEPNLENETDDSD